MRLCFFGDVMLGRLMNLRLQQVPSEQPWDDTLPILRSADVRLCNLECVLSDHGRPWSLTPKVFHFRSDARNVAVLSAGGVDGVSVANNHILDFEYDAMLDTLHVLDQAGITHAGAGRDLEAAMRPGIIPVDGQAVGLVAFTDCEPAWEAKPEFPGVFHVPLDPHDRRAEALLTCVERTRPLVDFLVVSAHWGPNWGRQVPAEQPDFARRLIDAGASLVFGHSAHVVRGVEVYRGSPIIYSAGAFLDDYAIDEVERNDQSFIFMFDTDRHELLLYPLLKRELRVRRAHGAAALEAARAMQDRCAELGTAARWIDDQQVLQVSAGLEATEMLASPAGAP